MSDYPQETPQVDEATALVSNLQQIRQENGYSTAIWSDERLNRAARGLIEYKKMLENLPQETAAKFIKDPGLQMCFLGVAPVEHFKADLGGDEIKQINSAPALRGEKYFIVSYPLPLSRSKNHALVNLEAAEAVMAENKDLFKDTGEPRDFLKTQPKRYLASAAFVSVRIQDQRHGVLAGYPRENVDTWSRINSGFSRDRFFNRQKEFSAGDIQQGFAFNGFSETDRTWANEAIALRQATGIDRAIKF